jgi:hypothetical protein
MQRRALLAAVPPALAGCIASPPGSPTSTTTRDPGSEPDADLAVTDLSVATEKVRPEHRYLVRITKTYSADAVADEPGEQTVVDVSAVEDRAVRDTLKEVLSEGKVRRDEIPDGLRDTVERVDFFTWDATTAADATYSHWAVEVYEADPDRDPVVRFDADLVDDAVSAADPGAIAFSLENVGDRTWEVFSGTVPPFGVLWAGTVEPASARETPDGDRYLLWRDYEAEGCVRFSDDGRMISCDIGKITPIQPGETVEKTYELRPENPVGTPLEPGEYVVSDTLSYSRENQGPSEKVEWRVAFAVEKA